MTSPITAVLRRAGPRARRWHSCEPAEDAAIVAWYGAKVAREAMVVDYAVYPWNEGEIPKDLAEQIGTDWLVFEVEELGGRLRATNKETGLAATAESLDALPRAVQVTIATRWPTDEGFAPSLSAAAQPPCV